MIDLDFSSNAEALVAILLTVAILAVHSSNQDTPTAHRHGRRVRVALHTSSRPDLPKDTHTAGIDSGSFYFMPVSVVRAGLRMVLRWATLSARWKPRSSRPLVARGRAAAADRCIEVGLQKAFFGVMPALIRDPPTLGTKVVSVFASNTAVGLPTHLATIVLLDR